MVASDMTVDIAKTKTVYGCPPQEIVDRMRQIQPLDQLPESLIPSDANPNPPVMFKGYPVTPQRWLSYAERNGLVVRGPRYPDGEEELKDLGTLRKVFNKIREDHGAFFDYPRDLVGAWGVLGLLWVVDSNYDVDEDGEPLYSHDMIREVGRCLGFDDEPKWYLSGEYFAV